MNAVGVMSEEVPRCFKNTDDALQYLSELLRQHDAWVDIEKAKRGRE